MTGLGLTPPRLGPPPAHERVDAMVQAVARDRPEATAAIDRDAAGQHRLTYGGLCDAAATLARQLRGRGLGRGDVVAVWLPNWSEVLVWQLALASLGAAAVGVNTRYHVHEVAHVLRRARPACVALPATFLELDLPERLAAATAEVAGDADPPAPPQVAIVRPPSPRVDTARFDVGGGAWSPATEPAPAPDPRAEPGQPSDTACVFTTSGSTSAPKLAAHDQRGVVRHSGDVAAAFDVRPGDAVLCVLPLSGVFGFTPALAALAAGAACVLTPAFDPPDAVRAMADHGVTHLVGGDDLFGRLKDAWHDDPVSLAAWRRGGIADFTGRTEEVLAWAQQRHGARISGVYGSSEVFALAAIQDPDLDIPTRAVGGGRLVSRDLAVRAVDREAGTPLGPGATGELQLRGPNVLSGYLGDPQASAAAFTPDGWFASGDLGWLTPGGEGLVYVCRGGDALRLRGFLVNPAEIEAFLASHEAVDVAQVVGVPDAVGGEAAVAFVRLHPNAGIDEDQLLAWCRTRLAGFKVPARIALVERFPTTSGTNGTKIQKTVLRQWAEGLEVRR